jgi:hypothetical protein
MYENQILNLVDSSEGVKTTEHTWSYKTNKCGCLHLQDSQFFKKGVDEVLTQQCPCLRAFDSWSVCGCLADSTGRTQEFTQVRPPGG